MTWAKIDLKFSSKVDSSSFSSISLDLDSAEIFYFSSSLNSTVLVSMTWDSFYFFVLKSSMVSFKEIMFNFKS